ncbi:hypothetical protein AB9M10_11270 [Rhodococcus erythropolis]
MIAQDSDEPALLISDPPITAVDFFPEEQAAFGGGCTARPDRR